jgi:uncharacterized protein (DUF362 family)/Pyruvate/2-oxoacid:ferredoxin oxidoreductase delta subunit
LLNRAEVAICHAAYDDTLKKTIYGLLHREGLDRAVRGRVLIKPNLLLAARPESAITTHPLVVRAVAEFVIDYGGRPVVADSPAVGKIARICHRGGYHDALKALDIPFVALGGEAEADIGPPFGRVSLARQALEADVVINLAKLKTHSQMTLTLGVKNIFGCVVGLKKPEWHMRAGIDKGLFARLIVQIHQAVAPLYTLIDGVVGLEGHGPGKAGRPVPLGLLIGSRCAHATDHAVCDLIGWPPERLPTLRAADELGISHAPLRVTGDGPERIRLQLPEAGTTRFGPEFIQPFLRRHLFRRPVADAGRCRMCGECWKYCPVQAIQSGDKRLHFNYNRCIRCYCCIEVCPHGAMTSAETIAGRWLRYLRSRAKGTDTGADL